VLEGAVGDECSQGCQPVLVGTSEQANGPVTTEDNPIGSEGIEAVIYDGAERVCEGHTLWGGSDDAGDFADHIRAIGESLDVVPPGLWIVGGLLAAALGFRKEGRGGCVAAVIEYEAGFGAEFCEFQAVCKFRGTHAEVEAEVEFSQQLYGFDELGFQAHGSGCIRGMQHLSNTANLRGLAESPDVVFEGWQSGATGDYGSDRGGCAGATDLNECFGFEDVIFGADVDFHVDRLHTLRPAVA